MAIGVWRRWDGAEWVEQTTMPVPIAILVDHGSNANEPRPQFDGPVIWTGTVVPNGVLAGDIVIGVE